MKKSFIIFTLILSCITVNAQKIHFICFADTNDPKIGAGVKQNVNLMTYFVMQLATGLSLENNVSPLIIMQGSDCNNKNLHSVIQGFQCSSEDIVIFSYLGHGGRSPQDKSDFPQMCLGSSNPSQFIPLEYVKDALSQKGPKFLLVLGDCCNSYSDAILPKSNTLVTAGPTRMTYSSADALKSLFRKTSGYVLSSGCQKGEYSWVSSSEGGFFTNGLLRVLDEYIGTPRSSYTWNELLGGVRSWVVQFSRIALAGQGGYIQTPIYRVNSEPNPRPKDSNRGPNATIKDIRTAMISICNQSSSATTRLNNSESILSSFFASNDAIIDIVGLDQKTIVDHMSASDYLLRLATVSDLANFNVVDQQKDSFGKITYLKVHEIYRGY